MTPQGKRYYVLLQGPARQCVARGCDYVRAPSRFRAEIEESAEGGASRLVSIEGDIAHVKSDRVAGEAVSGRDTGRVLEGDGSARFTADAAGSSSPDLAGEREGDDGGHLIAARFGGPTNVWNLVPMAASFNRSNLRGRWGLMENAIAKALKAAGSAALASEHCPFHQTARGHNSRDCLVLRGRGTMRVQIFYDPRDPSSPRPVRYHVRVAILNGGTMNWQHRVD